MRPSVEMTENTPEEASAAAEQRFFLSRADDQIERFGETYLQILQALAVVDQIETLAIAPSFRLADGAMVQLFDLGLSEQECCNLVTAEIKKRLTRHKEAVRHALASGYQVPSHIIEKLERAAAPENQIASDPHDTDHDGVGDHVGDQAGDQGGEGAP